MLYFQWTEPLVCFAYLVWKLIGWRICIKKLAMPILCPYCHSPIRQAKNRDGPNFCPSCRRLFYLPEERKLPPWILGVLTILVANWHIMAMN